MNGSLLGGPGQGAGLGDRELTSGEQQGRGTPSSEFAVGHPVSGWVRFPRPTEVRAPRAAWEEVWVALVRRAAPLA